MKNIKTYISKRKEELRAQDELGIILDEGIDFRFDELDKLLEYIEFVERVEHERVIATAFSYKNK